jgi:hypothetical protein
VFVVLVEDQLLRVLDLLVLDLLDSLEVGAALGGGFNMPEVEEGASVQLGDAMNEPPKPKRMPQRRCLGESRRKSPPA